MDDFILVKTEQKGKLVKVKINDIVYIESMGKYVYFHTKEGEKIMALLNITGLEERLPGDRFLRIHKSFIIAIPFIIMIHGNMIHLEFTKNLKAHTLKFVAEAKANCRSESEFRAELRKQSIDVFFRRTPNLWSNIYRPYYPYRIEWFPAGQRVFSQCI